MMSDVEIKSIDQLMREGIAAAQRHDQVTAQVCFAEVLSQDGQHELGWLWLASVVDAPADKRECFTNVLTINPANATAQSELAKLDALDAPPPVQPIVDPPTESIDRPINPTGAAWSIAPTITPPIESDPLTALDAPLHASSIEVIGAQVPTQQEKAISALRQFLAPFQEIPQSTRRQLLVLLAVVGVVALVLIITHRASPPSDQPPTDASVAAVDPLHPLAVMQDNTGTPTPVPPTPTATTIRVTQGIQLSTLEPVVLPPSWTPVPTGTSAVPATPTPLSAPPASLTGKLAIISGSIATHNNFWPVIITAPDGSQSQQALSDPDRAEYVQLVPDGKQMIYVYATQGADSRLLQIAFRNGSSPRLLSEAWGNNPGLNAPHGAMLSSDGHLLAFAAQDIQGKELYPSIYVLNLQSYLGLTTPPTATIAPTVNGAPTEHIPPGVLLGTSTPLPTPIVTATATPSLATQYLMHVTPLNNGIDDWPSIAPNDQFVAFTVDSTNSGENAIDLYAALIQPGSAPLRLTKDGGTLIKTASAWSPDSKQIAFTSTPKDSSYSDIELINSDGGSRQMLVHIDKVHNIRPHWSPDGKYIAFTSDRTGIDQVFMINVATRQLYQITNDRNTNILTDWGSQ